MVPELAARRDFLASRQLRGKPSHPVFVMSGLREVL
jgi:hypothetical protein